MNLTILGSQVPVWYDSHIIKNLLYLVDINLPVFRSILYVGFDLGCR